MRRNAGTLAAEIKQGKPFRSLSQEGVLGLFRTAEMLRHRFSRALEPEDVTLQQYNVLRILRGAGPEGLPTLEIRQRMVERTPGVTGLVDRLAAKELVERERCAHDRRVVYCRITPAGRALLSRLDAAIDEADDGALGALSENELRSLIVALDRVRASLRPGAGPDASPTSTSI